MIGSIRGTIIEINNDRLIIETGGVGYTIHTTTPPHDLQVNDQVHIWTEHIVRENNSDLYGFFDTTSRSLFGHLLNIPKIGPKSAQQILQKASVDLIVQCTQTNDPKRLAKQSGLGPKTAEKIVTALTDALDMNEFVTIDTTPSIESALQQDVMDALIALGYAEREAYEVATKVCTEYRDEPIDTSTAISQALKQIGSKR